MRTNAAVFEFNLENTILAKKEVCHALVRAIDRNFINNAIFTAYNDEAPFDYPLDLAKANALLDKASYPKGGGRNLFSLRLTSMPSGVFRKTSEYLHSSFGKIGIITNSHFARCQSAILGDDHRRGL